jgi:hypothetical protein
MNVTLTDSIISSIQINDIVTDITHQSNVFLIENNLIRWHRARAMLIKASNGIIRNNIMNGSSIEDTHVKPEPFTEADYGQNITVEGNWLSDSGIFYGRIPQPAGRLRVGYGYEHGMDVKIGNLERQISFVKFRLIRNSKIYIVKYCCLVKIIQLFLNNCLDWLSFFLYIPASSASSKRIFGESGRTLETRRQLLSPDSLDALVFLRHCL